MLSSTLRVAALATSLSLLPAQGDLLYTICTGDGNLRTFDLDLGATTSSVLITDGVFSAQQCNGMTRDPTTGTTYALVRFTGSNARSLCTIDLATGLATVIAPMSDNFSGLACRIDGTLFGVTGDGANTPETLWTIDKTTAVATLVRPLGAGNDGETIGFADDLFLYHASGYNVPINVEVFEQIDTFTGNTITTVPMSGFDFEELTVLAPFVGPVLLGADLNDDVVAITTSGHVSYLTTLDHGTVRGLVYEPSPNTQGWFRLYGFGCAASVGAVPVFYGTGTPTAGQAVGFHLQAAPAASFGILAIGVGVGALPVPSPTCPVQIDPVIGASAFFTNATGEVDFPFTLPTPFPAIDLFMQCGVLDGSAFVVSNPVQMHTP